MPHASVVVVVCMHAFFLFFFFVLDKYFSTVREDKSFFNCIFFTFKFPLEVIPIGFAQVVVLETEPAPFLTLVSIDGRLTREYHRPPDSWSASSHEPFGSGWLPTPSDLVPPPRRAPGAVRVGRLPRLSFGKDNLLHGRGVGVVDLSDLQTAASHVREGGGLGTFGVLALWPSPESNDSQFGKALQRGRRFALRLHSKNVVEDGVQEASGSFVRALPREQRG